MSANANPMMDAATLAEYVRDARRHTLSLIADLSDDQLLGPHLEAVNPLLWEIGHVAWFQEKWVLRHAGKRKPLRNGADDLYDSSAIAHCTRWDLLLPSREETLRYMCDVENLVLRRLQQAEPTEQEKYFILLSLYHEDMHTEAFTYTRQTLGYSAPRFRSTPPQSEKRRTPASSEPRVLTAADTGALPGDVEIPGGKFMLGASRKEPFVLDNEKWAHPIAVKPFAMARAPVTQSQFAAFVDDNGYRRRELWNGEGWSWRESVGARQPVYWRRTAKSQKVKRSKSQKVKTMGEAGPRTGISTLRPSNLGPSNLRRSNEKGWQRRRFNEWAPLEPHQPVIHVNWYEAQAYCRWAQRRLPTEAEWEVAAAAEPALNGGTLSSGKRRFPWGDDLPNPRLANSDWRHMDCLDVAALSESDGVFGCRQMIGNVWEWTVSDFLPYPGFTPDPYRDYSQPWFNTRKVLRGGCWATRARLIRNTWRNFFRPDRRDVLAGFRTCAG